MHSQKTVALPIHLGIGWDGSHSIVHAGQVVCSSHHLVGERKLSKVRNIWKAFLRLSTSNSSNIDALFAETGIMIGLQLQVLVQLLRA